MKRTIVACLCFLLFGAYHCKAQINDAPALQHYYDFSPDDTNKLLLDFWNQNFLKNSEYFGPITHGMTLFGDDINAQLAWVPDKHIMLVGGIFARKDFGNYNFEIVQPTFTLKLQNNKGISLIFGNLESGMDHRYIEPLYQWFYPLTYFYQQTQNPLETGLQLKIDKPWIWLDMWIDWARQEYLNSNFHENILQGGSANFTVFHPSDVFNISIPAQYTIYHLGGQVDTARNVPYVSIFNGAIGLCLNWDFSKRNSFISQVKLENYYCGYNDISINPNDAHIFPYQSGNAGYLNFFVKSKYGLGLMASFWDGIDWVAPIGGDLYQSISWVYRYYHEDNRRLVFLRLFYQKELFPNLFVDLRLEPYSDLNLKFTEFSYYIFFTYKRTFTLTKVHLPKFDDGAYSH